MDLLHSVHHRGTSPFTLTQMAIVQMETQLAYPLGQININSIKILGLLQLITIIMGVLVTQRCKAIMCDVCTVNCDKMNLLLLIYVNSFLFFNLSQRQESGYISFH